VVLLITIDVEQDVSLPLLYPSLFWGTVLIANRDVSCPDVRRKDDYLLDGNAISYLADLEKASNVYVNAEGPRLIIDKETSGR